MFLRKYQLYRYHGLGFGSVKEIEKVELQPVPPSTPSEAQSPRSLDVHCAPSGINEGTGCNFIFFSRRYCQLQQGDVGKFSYNLERNNFNISSEEIETIIQKLLKKQSNTIFLELIMEM